MKIAIINDQHFGVRNDSSSILDYQEKFYKDIFFPTLIKRGITTVLDLGDTFDRRKYVNFVTLDRVKSFYFDNLLKHNIELKAIVGNHSVYYRNTNEINSLDLLLREYNNIEIYEKEPVEITLGSTQILMVPWITKYNEDECGRMIQKTSAQICMGHFEIKGFEMMKGRLCEHGFDKNEFKKFEAVYSGHFHHPSEYSNIKYLGAPYEMNWSDYNGKRGFHIFDTETRELEFVENPYRMFVKAFYDDSDMNVEDIEKLDVSQLTDVYCKVIIENKTNPYIFDLYMDKIQSAYPIDLKVVEDYMMSDEFGEEDLIDEAQDTRTILNSYVDNIETNVDKGDLRQAISDLYTEATSI